MIATAGMSPATKSGHSLWRSEHEDLQLKSEWKSRGRSPIPSSNCTPRPNQTCAEQVRRLLGCRAGRSSECFAHISSRQRFSHNPLRNQQTLRSGHGLPRVARLGAHVAGLGSDVGARVLRHDGGSADVLCVWFDFNDARTQSLANVLLRWEPSVNEIQAVERAMNVLGDRVRVHWPPQLTRHGIPRRPPNPRKVFGQILKSSQYVSVGVDAFVNAMGVLELIPFVLIEVASNPAASWLAWPSLGVEWRCRLVDFVAIALHLTRLYGGLSVDLATDLRVVADAEYKHVAAPPLQRMIR